MDDLAVRFLRFARDECAGLSPLYERLSYEVARDREVRELAAGGQRPQNLLFGAVHYLLLGGAEHPLREFYAGRATGDPYPWFRGFCLDHADKIRELVDTRLVQTNEVGRCAALMPVFTLLPPGPLALIEVGASAGLNLLLDRYRYVYSNGACGEPDSPVVLRCEGAPPLPERMPEFVSRVGIDLRPIDLTDPDQTRWLRALVWPDEGDRLAVLGAALEMARADPPRVVAGDAVDVLPRLLDDVPDRVTPVVVHTFTLWALDENKRPRLYGAMHRDRDVYCISVEAFRRRDPEIELHRFRCGARDTSKLGRFDHHGAWIDWTTPPQ
jgi:hypothetical protein